MLCKLIHETEGQRTFVAVLKIGDEVMACLQRLAETHHMSAAQITAIGAFEHATLAFWDWEKKQYQEIPVREQVEVLSLIGDVALEAQDRPKLHLHAVLGRRDGSTLGGHLLKAVVRPTLEAVITESPAHLRRVPDPVTGLSLIKLGA
jgi:predicted DNA-binding protein with PD1-like motif